MDDVLTAVGLWTTTTVAILATGWGLAVLITGRAPRRELRQFSSTAQYGRYCLGLGAVFGLLALGSGLDGWFKLCTLGGFGLLASLIIHQRRARRKAV